MLQFKKSRVVCLAILLGAASCKKTAPASEKPPTPSSGASEPAPSETSPTHDATATAPSVPGEGSQGTTQAAPSRALPPQFTEFEAMLRPLVDEAPSDARSRKTCKLLEPLRIKSLAIRRNMPVGVDAKAWEEASDEMRGAFEGLGAVCTDDPPNDANDLPTIQQSYLKLVALLPK